MKCVCQLCESLMLDPFQLYSLEQTGQLLIEYHHQTHLSGFKSSDMNA